MSAQIAGLEPATRVASRKLGPTSGRRSPLRQVPGRLGDEGVGDRVRHPATVAIRWSCAAGVDRLGTGAEPRHGALQAVVEEAAGALCRGQVPAGALEEVGAGVGDAGGLGARQRVAADEASVGTERGDDVALGRADVGDRGVRARAPRAPPRRAPAAARPAPRRRPPRRPRRPPRSSPWRCRRRRWRAPPRASPRRGRSRPPRRRGAPAPPARSSRRSARRRGRRSAASRASGPAAAEPLTRTLRRAGPGPRRRTGRAPGRCPPSRGRRR